VSAPVLLEVKHLTRDYALRTPQGLSSGKVLRAVNDVSFALPEGSVLGIVGESGCGKSTLARIVMALDRPTSGEVLFESDSLFQLSAGVLRQRRRDFQMVFQDPYGSLDPRHSVGRIIAEPLHLGGSTTKRERDASVAEVLESVGLKAADAVRYPHEFSGGQRQRIAIARALITRPRYITTTRSHR